MKRPSTARQKSRQPNRRAVLILGMHRSGTSALAGVACALGASAPKNLLPANFANPSGYWESFPLMQAHDELLASAGSSWDDWRRLDPEWFESNEAQRFHGRIINVLKSEFEEKPLIVVKDPRLCRFMMFFLSVLEDMAVAPVALFALRDPLEVALSLHRRDGFSISKSIALWLRHVLEAELYSRKLPRCIIFYERLLKDWRREMSRAQKRIGVDWPVAFQTSAASIESFLATDLHHEKNESRGQEKHPELMFLAAETYRLLRAISKAEAGHDLFAKIDAVRAKFNEASDFFGAILRTEEFATQQLRSELNQKSSELEHQRKIVDQRNVQQQELADQNHRREIERLELSAELARKKDEYEHLTADLESLKNVLDDLQSILAVNRDSERLTRDIKELDERHEELQVKISSQEANLDRISGEIVEYRKKIEDSQKLLFERNEQNRATQAQIDAFYESRSWRMTGPLRAARRFFLRLRVFVI